MADAPAQASPVTEDQVTSLPADQLTVAVPAFEAAPVPEAGNPASESVSFDYSSPDGIRAAAESNPALRNYLEKQRLDTENTVKQRLQREWEREQGSVERAQQTVKSIVERLNQGEDPDAVARELPHYVKANEAYMRSEVLKTLAQQAIDMATPAEQSALRELLEKADTPEAVTEIAQSTLNALTNKVKADTLEGIDPEELATHPKFKDYIDAWKTRELESEMTAQRTEASIRSGAPATPTGVAPAATSDVVEHIVNMPPDEQQAYMLDLAMNNPAEFERVEALLMAAAG